MTTFDRREEAFENKFAHDEELEFKAHARRNRKLGLWAAGLLGKTGHDADEYAQALISAEIEGNGSAAIARKLAQDFAVGGVTQTEHQIQRRMGDLLDEARREVQSM